MNLADAPIQSDWMNGNFQVSVGMLSRLMLLLGYVPVNITYEGNYNRLDYKNAWKDPGRHAYVLVYDEGMSLNILVYFKENDDVVCTMGLAVPVNGVLLVDKFTFGRGQQEYKADPSTDVSDILRANAEELVNLRNGVMQFYSECRPIAEGIGGWSTYHARDIAAFFAKFEDVKPEPDVQAVIGPGEQTAFELLSKAFSLSMIDSDTAMLKEHHASRAMIGLYQDMKVEGWLHPLDQPTKYYPGQRPYVGGAVTLTFKVGHDEIGIGLVTRGTPEDPMLVHLSIVRYHRNADDNQLYAVTPLAWLTRSEYQYELSHVPAVFGGHSAFNYKTNGEVSIKEGSVETAFLSTKGFEVHCMRASAGEATNVDLIFSIVRDIKKYAWPKMPQIDHLLLSALLQQIKPHANVS